MKSEIDKKANLALEEIEGNTNKSDISLAKTRRKGFNSAVLWATELKLFENMGITSQEDLAEARQKIFNNIKEYLKSKKYGN